jgi:hypothetical protein
MRAIVLLAVSVVALVAQAAEPSARDVAERQRIASERAAVEAAYAQRRSDCETRFAVTPCIEQARAARRESLGHLRRQEGLLDEAQRKQRAAERMAAIRQKVSAEEARQREPVRSKPREAPMRVVAPRAGKAAPTPAAPASAASAARAAAEARSRARYEARQQEAQKLREAAELRAAQRARSTKPPSAPLPPPPR